MMLSWVSLSTFLTHSALHFTTINKALNHHLSSALLQRDAYNVDGGVFISTLKLREPSERGAGVRPVPGKHVQHRS